MPRAGHPRDELDAVISQDKPGYVRALFDSIAGNYDRMNWVMTGGLLALWHRSFAKATRLKKGESALDVCCGTGDLSFIAAKLVGEEGRVVGLDFSQEMLGIARQRAEKASNDGGRTIAPIEWVHGDALNLPFPDGDADRGFSCVSMGFALRNVADIGRSLQEMARVARVGGRVVCLEVSQPTNGLLRLGFQTYFFKVVPVLGRWAEKRQASSGPLARLRPYTYLPYSLERLPAPDRIVQLMQEAGLGRAWRQPLTGGIVSLYIGVKEG